MLLYLIRCTFPSKVRKKNVIKMWLCFTTSRYLPSWLINNKLFRLCGRGLGQVSFVDGGGGCCCWLFRDLFWYFCFCVVQICFRAYAPDSRFSDRRSLVVAVDCHHFTSIVVGRGRCGVSHSKNFWDFLVNDLWICIGRECETCVYPQICVCM